MNLPDGLLDTGWTLVAWMPFVVATVIAARQARWRVLLDSSRLNAFLAMIVALILLWQLQAGVKPGLSLHLLGATVFTLCFGWQLAFLGLSVVLLGVTLNGAAGWQAFALNAVLMAGVGVGVSHTGHRLVDRLLPGHLFVFIFCKGFFTAALAVLAVGLVSSLVFALAGAYSGQYLADDYLPYFFLLAFSEAWLSGMLSTLLAVYRPQLLADGSDALFPGGK
ncbi:energy-coupling factor ABC transporter permease [Accumulibacter sp.]|uniref:energy-coupling factor ABC transporter permease n=1 Tax=Accumulibacter sp. TaxID=2053492 RepID=UPI0025FF68B6|nr:energy-coupling factor ABC transporter permease [Accumulibacter sp.]MCM8611320.1 energy-coupling factor ABC transporter permease [Accumulibacter sp.]MCM8635033.1 energy-coupling factor ABC transporter permease [Accumulibacter sp.]MCM8639821.1 energy-coupling factor ABC transporter permease [Accumulibacter sp.]